MAEFLLELFSEEIPARMQARAAEDLKTLLIGGLKAAGLDVTQSHAYVTPRRLCLVIDDLPKSQPDVCEEKRGPRVGAPQAALDGFLNAAGISLQQCEQRDTGKGVFYFAVIHRKGRSTAEILKETIEGVMTAFPWPKSMRWGAHTVRWVRPLHSILCLFDGQVIPVTFGPVQASHTTAGHRFLSPERFAVSSFEDYRAKLRAAYVILDPAERRTIISDGTRALAEKQGLTLKPDEGLLHEVTGLVEWPVPLLGSIDDAFMDVPSEVLSTAMRAHQKYFSLLKTADTLAPHFIVVANMETADRGERIIAGNQRVLRARLSDAKFFWDSDRRKRLDSCLPALAERLFYAGLGSMADKAARLSTLSGHLATLLKTADFLSAERAGRLCKADLSSGMVGEFPELQGIMGRYYALNDGETADVALAIADHYAPQGPNDRCPSAPLSVIVSLADKIDTLTGFFALGEKPTGSKDPFALRRAALGIIRLVLENNLRLPLRPVIEMAHQQYAGILPRDAAAVTNDLLDFFADRLKVHLRERGVRHDLVNAIFSLGTGEDDLVRLLTRVSVLSRFLDSEDGSNLLTAFRRAANIVRIEEKKDGISFAQAVQPELLTASEEKDLFAALSEVSPGVAHALEQEDFSGAMTVLARLRSPVDAFFDKVTVNCETATVRINRLRLLSRIGVSMGMIADFAQIEG